MGAQYNLIEPDYERDLSDAIASSARIMREAIAEVRPDYIVSMVSGGRDSAASHAIAEELGVKIDLIIHGQTRTGIPETTEFVVDQYGRRAGELAVADAGTNYEDYVLRSGFFGVGRSAHNHAYHVLKNRPFRATLSRYLRQRRRGVKIMLLGGARKYESENRRLNLQVMTPEADQKNNVWVSICHEWTAEARDSYLATRQVPINPVATQLCRSGECMCGTMQSQADRLEASALYPQWGAWLDSLEAEVRAKHGYGWGDRTSKRRNLNQHDLFEGFQPMCVGCKGSDPGSGVPVPGPSASDLRPLAAIQGNNTRSEP